MPIINSHTVAIIGGGPAGLMAAEVLSQYKIQVDLYDSMPSVGRKFLMAGKSGLNLTHAEPLDLFLSRYGAHRPALERMIREFGPQQLRDWAYGLGIETFVGSSGKVFPLEMKAAPLLRAWLHRLRRAGVLFHMRHRWVGFSAEKQLRFMTPQGEQVITADATLLALGGGSWARLGSTGEWVPVLSQAGVNVQPLRPANCGFNVAWSDHMRARFAGQPVKSVTMSFTGTDGVRQDNQGDFVITEYGLEGSLVYAFASAMVSCIEVQGQARIELDLLPALSRGEVVARLSQERGRRSMAEHLRRKLGVSGVKAALLREVLSSEAFADPQTLAAAIKKLPIVCISPRPIDEAISTSGGVTFESMDKGLMLRGLPGIFCAGEMLDWDAPTGGYLLTGCFASGNAAAEGVVKWLGHNCEK